MEDEGHLARSVPVSVVTAPATTVMPSAADSSAVSSLGHTSVDATQRRPLPPPPGWVYDIHGLPVSVSGAVGQPNGTLDVVVSAVPGTSAPPGHGLPPEQISGVDSNPPGSTPLTSPGQTDDANANPMSPTSRKIEEVMLKTQAQLAEATGGSGEPSSPGALPSKLRIERSLRQSRFLARTDADHA